MSPENRPTPLAALQLPETPAETHYRRNHFPYPDPDGAAASLEITGAVERPLRLPLEGLREQPSRTLAVVLECAGHRRTEYDPPISGVQWKAGALGQARWTGTSLAAVLQGAGPHPDAVEVVLHGADRGPFAGVDGEWTFSRSLPLEKALHPDTLLAWEMDGEPLPHVHGGPLRAVVPGWYAMDSVKWLTRIEVVTEPFRGPFQELDYRFQPADEPGIGTRLAELPISALILSPEEGAEVRAGRVAVSGIAWGGGGAAEVHVRVDGGSWRPAAFNPESAPSPYTKRAWTLECDLPPGEHRLAVRATDQAGRSQPEQPVWNRRGYANNSIHQVRIQVR
jgi:DMSO/TMAO reductase YedYZ molybdopterin-dependent catalytic subunit